MADRTTAQQQALFVGPTPSTGTHAGNHVIKEISHLTDLSFDFSKNTENIQVFGQAAPIDRKSVGSPDVSMSFSYYVVDMVNERNLGFDIGTGTSALASILAKTEDDKNYLNVLSDEGTDIVGENGTGNPVRGIGNGFISSYSVRGAVGEFLSATVDIQGLNIVAYSDGVAQDIPAVNPITGLRITSSTFTLPTVSGGYSGQVSSIGQGDITIDSSSVWAAPFQNITGACIQSFDISYDLSLEEQECLGSAYAKSRNVTFPIDVTLSVEAQVGDLTTGDLADLLCEELGYDLTVTCRQPSCGASVGAVAAQYQVKNAKLESSSYSQGIGDNETVSVSWVGSIGAAGDTVNGLYMSGITGYVGGTGAGIQATA